MATLVFSAVGSLFGSQLGGAIGALVGRQIDALIMPRRTREGPRLTELGVSTSSYGMAIPRLFGTNRIAGTVIWSTDLVEHRDSQGNGKGRPATSTYNYSASFAVALSSRRVHGLGRIWADGKLLRGAAGDLKVPGIMRLHAGTGDQAADGLIASAEGPDLCPAWRGLAYVVFENLHLAEFGNRIPALTFEVIADSAELNVGMLLETLGTQANSTIALPQLRGLMLDGPPVGLLALIDQVMPMDCHAAADRIAIGHPVAAAAELGAPAITIDDDSFGRHSGQFSQRQAASAQPLGVLRYYDPDRDYQPGAQRAQQQPRSGQASSLDLPATLTASAARRLIERSAAQTIWARQTLKHRSATLDPDLLPGRTVTVPGRAGLWTIQAWEWRVGGIELELQRTPPPLDLGLTGDSGRAGLPLDLATAPSLLDAFELPWDGTGSGSTATIWVAASSVGAGWSGGALLAQQADGTLAELDQAARVRAITGAVLASPGANSPHLLDQTSVLEVGLASADLALGSTSIEALLQGANRALVGEELIQFITAEQVAPHRWRLAGLLRGRGGTEHAIAAHPIGAPFVLLDQRLVALDGPMVVQAQPLGVAIIGLADSAPVLAPIRQRGLTLRPLAPVHGTATHGSDSGLELSWIRRARGAWAWLDGVDAPLNEQFETWQVDFGPVGESLVRWTVPEARLAIDPAAWAELQLQAPTGYFQIRQIGTHAVSLPLVIAP